MEIVKQTRMNPIERRSPLCCLGKRMMRTVTLLFLPLCFFILPLISCGGGDDDGRRLGEQIVGTWLRGWNEGDVIIEGSEEYDPDNFDLDHLEFSADGTYNGMVRSGSFVAYNELNLIMYKGSYRCDNNNLKLEYTDTDGMQGVILAQVLSFSESEMWVKYTDDNSNITVTMVVRKAQAES